MSPMLLIMLICAIAMGALTDFIGHEITGSIQIAATFGALVGMPAGAMLGAVLGSKTGA